MTAKSLADRVVALEAKVGSKTIEAQFREQAELIDRLFAYRFEEMDKKWDARLEAKLESKLKPIQNDLSAVRDAVKIILARLT